MPLLNLPKFLFINGPAGSGKSTLQKLLLSHGNCFAESFAEPIRQTIYSVFFPEEGPIYYNFNLKHQEVKKKEFPFTTGLKAKTFRDVMISFSEDWMKPTFGEDIFGRLAFQRCVENDLFYDHFIFDDSGFAAEAMHIIKMASPENCALIRLYRDGHNFSNDSRSYIKLPCRSLDLYNNGTEADMLDSLAAAWGNL